mmetsp:Transcript_28768/g.86345  ORF Transcript_28768/g.86345 Transcript_28768/m.86345 type:complete len:114 (+) Transcript_28768:83-424(+)
MVKALNSTTLRTLTSSTTSSTTLQVTAGYVGKRQFLDIGLQDPVTGVISVIPTSTWRSFGSLTFNPTPHSRFALRAAHPLELPAWALELAVETTVCCFDDAGPIVVSLTIIFT